MHYQIPQWSKMDIHFICVFHTTVWQLMQLHVYICKQTDKNIVYWTVIILYLWFIVDYCRCCCSNPCLCEMFNGSMKIHLVDNKTGFKETLSVYILLQKCAICFGIGDGLSNSWVPELTKVCQQTLKLKLKNILLF